MKSVFKRFLLLGLSLSIIVLVAKQGADDPETESSPDDHGKSTEEPPQQAATPEADHRTIPFRPLVGTKVTFSGTVVRAGSRFALRETAGILYTLDSAGRAWPFEGNSVRVTGQLDTTTRLLHIDDIQSMIA
jgi:hypothetical protein